MLSLFYRLHNAILPRQSFRVQKISETVSMERQYIMVFLELLPLTRICSINQLKQVSYSVLSFFTISRNMLGLSGDLNITSVLSSINCKCSIISPFTFFVDVISSKPQNRLISFYFTVIWIICMNHYYTLRKTVTTNKILYIDSIIL